VQVPLVYRKGALLGIDIGSHTAKIAQVKRTGKGADVLAYGHIDFPSETVVEGVIVDPDALAQSIKPLLQAKEQHFSAKRVATALPVAKVFTRTLQLPVMDRSDMDEAIKLEAEQSIPVPPTDLYMDHEVIGVTKPEKGDPHTDVLMIAAPRAIVDSYVKLFDALGLEIAAVEISLMSVARAVMAAGKATAATLVMDFGSASADMAVYDQVIRFTGTAAVGGDNITMALVKNLGVTAEQANEIKYKFGIGPSGLQTKVMEALDPLLKSMTSEMKKAIKYYQDRAAGKQISQVVISGGSANMPGLIDYLKQNLGIQIETANPWSGLGLKHVKAPDALEAPMYATAIGLALLEVQHD
jgi:type IV pilus assembly protein PilM